MKKKPQHASDYSDHYKHVSKSELGQTHWGFVRMYRTCKHCAF